MRIDWTDKACNDKKETFYTMMKKKTKVKYYETGKCNKWHLQKSSILKVDHSNLHQKLG